MKKLLNKYFQIILVSLLILFITFMKGKTSYDEDVFGFLNETFTSPIVDQKVKTNVKNRKFKDGVYKGDAIDAYYGYMQTELEIIGGKITDITFLQFPIDNTTSEYVNSMAMPILRSEALQIQDSEVDIVSGASNSSRAFRKSLETALSKAQ